MASDEELSRLAEAAILQEAHRGALRAEMVGPSGWLKPRVPSTNKKFLRNTIKGAIASNQVKDLKHKRIKETKLEEFERELKEKRKYKRRYLQATTKINKDEQSTCTKREVTVKNTDNDNSKPVNGIAWNDDGLEISCAIITKTRPLQFSNTSKSKTLPRNIKFIPQSKFGVT